MHVIVYIDGLRYIKLCDRLLFEASWLWKPAGCQIILHSAFKLWSKTEKNYFWMDSNILTLISGDKKLLKYVPECKKSCLREFLIFSRPPRYALGCRLWQHVIGKHCSSNWLQLIRWISVEVLIPVTQLQITQIQIGFGVVHCSWQMASVGFKYWS